MPEDQRPALREADGRSRRSGEWINHGTLSVEYSSWWMTLTLADVERPDGSHTQHEIVRGPDAAGIVVLRPEAGVLMIWRHRVVPNTWGWEIPGGAIESGETADEAARRECLEETGWSVDGPCRLLSQHHPSVGLVNQTFHLFSASAATLVGEPADTNEAALVRWRSPNEIRRDLHEGLISDGFTQLGIALVLDCVSMGPWGADR